MSETKQETPSEPTQDTQNESLAYEDFAHHEARLPYPDEPAEPAPFVPMVVPALLEVSPDLASFVSPDTTDGLRLQGELIPLMRQGLFYELGVRFPNIHIRLLPEHYSSYYNFSIYDTSAASGRTLLEHVLVGEAPKRLEHFRVNPKPAKHPISQQVASWVHQSHCERIDQLNLPYWTLPDFLVLTMAASLKEHAHEFIGIQEIRAMLDLLEPAFPDLVGETLNALPLPVIRRVLRALVQEKFSICNLRQILEILIDASFDGITDYIQLVDKVRAGMSRFLSYRHAFDERHLVVHIIESDLEAYLLNYFFSEPLPARLDTYPKGNDIIQDLFFALSDRLANAPFSAAPPVFLTHARLRRPLAKLFQHKFPEISVLAFHEVDPHFQLQIVDTITTPKPMFQ